MLKSTFCGSIPTELKAIATPTPTELPPPPCTRVVVVVVAAMVAELSAATVRSPPSTPSSASRAVMSASRAMARASASTVLVAMIALTATTLLDSSPAAKTEPPSASTMPVLVEAICAASLAEIEMEPSVVSTSERPTMASVPARRSFSAISPPAAVASLSEMLKLKPTSLRIPKIPARSRGSISRHRVSSVKSVVERSTVT